MRTTVDLDEDILKVAKHLAQERAQSLGRVLSDLAPQGLQPPAKPKTRAGIIPALARKPGATRDHAGRQRSLAIRGLNSWRSFLTLTP